MSKKQSILIQTTFHTLKYKGNVFGNSRFENTRGWGLLNWKGKKIVIIVYIINDEIINVNEIKKLFCCLKYLRSKITNSQENQISNFKESN